ncbi:MAG: hypothetical protein Kow0080_15290 [Candidatus Promineifilaceae bacterium]
MFSLHAFSLTKQKKDGRETAVSGDIIPLHHLPIGRPARLVQSSVEPQINRRLAELGLTPGVSLSILQDSGGPLLLSVRGARVAVGRETAVQLAVQML